MHTAHRTLFMALIVSLCTCCALSGLQADEVELSDVPLATLPSSGPANIMFVLDDSGSMDWSFMTPEDSGTFHTTSSPHDGYYWVFDDPGDHLGYGSDHILDASERMRWKSQWHGYNAMYYNPAVTYSPWPRVLEIANESSSDGLDDRSSANADPTTPRSHPMESSYTFDLTETYHFFAGDEIIIDDQDDSHTDHGTDGVMQSIDNNLHDYNDTCHRFERPDENNAWFEWKPDLTADDYEVFVWWPGESDDDTDVYFEVHHGGSVSNSTTFNQLSSSCSYPGNEGCWVSLGTFTLSDGDFVRMEAQEARDVAGENPPDMNADAVKFVPPGGGSVDIPRAHYYVWSELEDRPYLITLDAANSEIEYYAAAGSPNLSQSDDTSEVVTSLTRVDSSNVPSDVQTGRTFSEEMQNFANWYSFYRRRELTATAAIAHTVSEMEGVRVGLRSINGNIKQEVENIHIGYEDNTDKILKSLYALDLDAEGTPLRSGLHEVGKYFDQSQSSDLSESGFEPYYNATAGGECQQAFAITMTDGYWNGNDPAIGDEDGDNTGFTDADGHELYAATSHYDPPSLADVAMYYYENDLSSSLANKVPTNPEEVPSGHDPANWQHMVTYGVSFGVTGSLDPESYTLDVNASSPDYPSWPDPTDSQDQHRVDDLWHAAVNGRGKFLSASDPMELVSSLRNIIENIEARVSSASSVSINGDELYEKINEDIRLFQSSYSSASWTGDVKSYSIIQSTGEVNATALWSAQDAFPSWTNRIVASFDGLSGVPFELAQLSSSQQSSLNSNASLVDYLRGDPSQEGGAFRTRNSVLGDIVHSSPVFHEGVIYAGANDGMLHAFNATSGRELFAYVPGLVIDSLADFASPSYRHTYFVDLTPVIEKGRFILDTDQEYESLLVGGLRKGGKGYYALDVTDASSISSESELASRVLWEYTNATHLGYTFSDPAIVRSNDPNHEWIILFGNGYNSANGEAELFMLDPDGTLIRRINTGAGYVSGTEKNGLSSPTPVDVNNDERVDYVYAGDLKGNLWKFDLTASDASGWEVAFESSNGTAQPLFQATNDSGQVQPITAKPDVMRHCSQHGYMVVFGTGKHLSQSDNTDTSQQTVYGIWDYGDDADNQEYLGSFERSPSPSLSNQPADVTLLEQERITGSQDLTVNGTIIRVTSNNEPDWATEPDGTSGQLPDPSGTVSNQAGWYLDLPESGERVVSPVMIRDGKAIFISHIPSSAPCSSGGYSIVHELDACDGSRLSSPAFDVDGDGVIDQNDMVQYNTVSYVPSGMGFQGKLQPPAITQMGGGIEIKYFSSSTGTIQTMRERAARTGITFWKEMVE